MGRPKLDKHKSKIYLTINEDVLNKARETITNISAFVETCLIKQVSTKADMLFIDFLASFKTSSFIVRYIFDLCLSIRGRAIIITYQVLNLSQIIQDISTFPIVLIVPSFTTINLLQVNVVQSILFTII